MAYFAFCFYLIYGPVDPDFLPERIPAARLFALLQRETGLPVRRAAPELDSVLVRYHETPRTGSASVIILVLRAQGLYVHRVRGRDGEEELFAGTTPRPPADRSRRFFVKVYAPRFLDPEKLLARFREEEAGEKVVAILEARTGKILLKAEKEESLAEALRVLGSLDKPPERGRTYHVFRCEGILVRELHKELLRKLSRELRNRSVFIPYTKANSLLVASGTRDWEKIREKLFQINPEGEVVGE